MQNNVEKAHQNGRKVRKNIHASGAHLRLPCEVEKATYDKRESRTLDLVCHMGAAQAECLSHLHHRPTLAVPDPQEGSQALRGSVLTGCCYLLHVMHRLVE